jgi:thiamine-monophosphate kinase
LRIHAGTQLARVAHAMIDVSDGLVQDVGHLCAASRVAAEIDATALPLAAALRGMPPARALALAATAGEDYELVAAVPAKSERALARLRLGCTLTRIGRIVAGPPAVQLRDAAGRTVALGRSGYDHFR